MKLCASMDCWTKTSSRNCIMPAYVANTAIWRHPTTIFLHYAAPTARLKKLATIAAAIEVGMEVCVGRNNRNGRKHAPETAACRAGPVWQAPYPSPVNILSPIPGTPLPGHSSTIRQRDHMTVALMRFIAPECTLHFAGGRAVP